MCFQENAHFIVVDLVLEVLEGVKWTLGIDQWTSMMDKPHDTHCKTRQKKERSSADDSPAHRQTCETHKHTHSEEHATTDSHWCENRDEEPGSDPEKKTLSFLSTDSGFEGKNILEKLFSRFSVDTFSTDDVESRYQ